MGNKAKSKSGARSEQGRGKWRQETESEKEMAMSEIKEAKSQRERFRAEPQPDGSFRIYNLARDPLPITREAALGWLNWMEDDGINTLRQLLQEKPGR
jgi:hypothetical protein